MINLWEEDCDNLSLTNLSLYDIVDGLPEDYEEEDDEDLISLLSCSSIDASNLI